MTADVAGDHDGIDMAGPWGLWVECGCGWISPTAYTPANARAMHRRHVEQRNAS